jgi:hypothetical protein
MMPLMTAASLFGHSGAGTVPLEISRIGIPQRLYPKRLEMSIKNTKDFWAGVIFLFFGIATMVLATRYRIGTAARMGPGYFPFFLGGVLTALGLIISARSLGPGAKVERIAPIHLRPVFCVLLAVVLFGLLLPSIGLAVSTVTLVILSSLGSHEFKLRDTLLSSAVLLIISLALFVYFLKIQAPAWPVFFVGRT